MHLYSHIRKIGAGSFGTVYLAQHTRSLTEDYYAVKVLQEGSSLQRALHKDLSHPNIVKMYDQDVDCDNMLVMEYVQGGDLRSYVSEQFELQEDLVVSILAQTALALQYLHQRNILHRDVKLENILLSSDGLVKLTDFGISCQLKGDQKCDKEGGTAAILSPERINKIPHDHKSDIWGLGCVLYELMTRSRPFEQQSLETLQPNRITYFWNVLNQPASPLKGKHSAWLESLVMTMLQKNPSKRPSTMDILQHKEIRKELVQLRAKHPEYKGCEQIRLILEPQLCLKTAKYLKQESELHPTFINSIKTSKSRVIAKKVVQSPNCEIDERFYSSSLPFLIQESKAKRENNLHSNN